MGLRTKEQRKEQPQTKKEVTFRAVEGEAVGMLEAPVMVLETIAAHRVIKGGRLKQSLMMESLDHRGLTPNAPQVSNPLSIWATQSLTEPAWGDGAASSVKGALPGSVRNVMCACVCSQRGTATGSTTNDTDTEANTSMEQTVMGVYVIQKEGAEAGDGPEDISVLIEGVEVLSGLGETAIAYALLFGLIYCLNLSYPPELKCTFEVLQKILLKLDYHPRHSS
ncbi:uncharacterized protein [Trachinotus anak]|uniref:uncharacterized protein isoform X2 n=1 Tax=Trachinotus anak TaxID=443729 RepID=UPI0039F186F4